MKVKSKKIFDKHGNCVNTITTVTFKNKTRLIFEDTAINKKVKNITKNLNNKED